MMSEDLFHELFALMSSSGPVNIPLARELSRHLSGQVEPLDPWLVEELVELVRVAEYRVAGIVPTLSFAKSVVPLGSREWGDMMVENMAPMMEPYVERFQEGAGRARSTLSSLAPAIAGAHLGTWVGVTATRVVGSCETGIPALPSDQVLLALPAIEEMADDLSEDGRTIRLWAALYETAHRHVFSLPHIREAYLDLHRQYATSVEILPASLLEQMEDAEQVGTPALMGIHIHLGEGGMLDTPLTGPERDNLGDFMGVTTSMARWLATKAGEETSPDIETIFVKRDLEANLLDSLGGRLIIASVTTEDIERGADFLNEVQNRFGDSALERLWLPGGIPLAGEIEDPVGWAARTLLDDSIL